MQPLCRLSGGTALQSANWTGVCGCLLKQPQGDSGQVGEPDHPDPSLALWTEFHVGSTLWFLLCG